MSSNLDSGRRRNFRRFQLTPPIGNWVARNRSQKHVLKLELRDREAQRSCCRFGQTCTHGAANSARAWEITDLAADKPSTPITAATKISGHPDPVPTTPSAANITAALPIASLREHSQTERML